MFIRPFYALVAAIILAASALQSTPAAESCEALNGKWVGSENLVGQRDPILANYTITAKGTDVTVAAAHGTATGSCEPAADAYSLKLNWGEVTSEMTFRLAGEDVAMFFWQNSAGDGGRGSLTRETTAR